MALARVLSCEPLTEARFQQRMSVWSWKQMRLPRTPKKNTSGSAASHSRLYTTSATANSNFRWALRNFIASARSWISPSTSGTLGSRKNCKGLTNTNGESKRLHSVPKRSWSAYKTPFSIRDTRLSLQSRIWALRVYHLSIVKIEMSYYLQKFECVWGRWKLKYIKNKVKL